MVLIVAVLDPVVAVAFERADNPGEVAAGIRAAGEIDHGADERGGDMTLRAVKAFFQHARDSDNTEPFNNAAYGKYATLMAIMGRTAIDEERAVTWDEAGI